MAKRLRWIMAGPWKHHKSGIYYFRKATPVDLKRKKAELAALGIVLKGEAQRSLDTRDKKEAERAYGEAKTKQEAQWDSWRGLLAVGGVDLTYKNQVALAGKDALTLVKKNSHEPLGVAWPHKMVAAVCDNLRASLGAGDPRAATAILDLGQELQSLPHLKLPSRLAALLSTEPEGPRRELALALAGTLVEYRDTVSWLRAPKVSGEVGVTLTKKGRKSLATEIAKQWEKAWETLAAYLDGDYRKRDWEDGIPSYEPQVDALLPPVRQTAGLSLMWLLEEKNRSREMTPTDFRVWKAKIKLFTDFIGHDDAQRITRDHVRSWRDSLVQGGKLQAETINKKHMAALKAVLNFGYSDFGLPENVARIRPIARQGGRGNNLAKGYSEEQAQAILAATFIGSTKDLSLPHQRAIRWVPWILAFTGLRVSEVTQFQGRSLETVNGFYLMRIHGGDGRNKTAREWSVAIHPQVVEMGLIKMFQTVGDGPAFYEPYSEGIELDRLPATHRGKYVPQRISKWITADLGIEAPNGKPNHAWRHRFTTVSRSCSMDVPARNYMMGSGDKNQRERYGGFMPEKLYKEICKLPRIEI
jgi:integrase